MACGSIILPDSYRSRPDWDHHIPGTIYTWPGDGHHNEHIRKALINYFCPASFFFYRGIHMIHRPERIQCLQRCDLPHALVIFLPVLTMAMAASQDAIARKEIQKAEAHCQNATLICLT